MITVFSATRCLTCKTNMSCFLDIPATLGTPSKASSICCANNKNRLTSKGLQSMYIPKEHRPEVRGTAIFLDTFRLQFFPFWFLNRFLLVLLLFWFFNLRIPVKVATFNFTKRFLSVFSLIAIALGRKSSLCFILSFSPDLCYIH